MASSLLVSCMGTPTDRTEDLLSAARTWTDGTPEVLGMLALVNDPSTTIEVLDLDAELDSRAAKSIVHHRDGADLLAGTPDDDLYEDVTELDARYYVGATALDRLYAFAETWGYVAHGDDLLGTWDDVTFTANEATETIAWVNAADDVTLDDALNRLAVDSIVAARPIDTVLALSELDYVGTSALETILELALQGSDDGIEGTFSNDVDAPIGWGVQSSILVEGLAPTAVDVVVTLDIIHERASDLVVTLTDPSEAKWMVWHHESNPSWQVAVPASATNGPWTLEVQDTVAGGTGELRGWSLSITSEADR